MYVLVSAIYIRLKFLSIYPVTYPGVEKLDNVTPLFYIEMLYFWPKQKIYIFLSISG